MLKLAPFFFTRAAELFASLLRYKAKSTRATHGEGKTEMEGSSVEDHRDIDLDVE